MNDTATPPPQTATARHDADLAEILTGLDREPKMLSPRFFYDERGSKLFEAICATPEYYLTRTETGILQTHLADMARRVGPRAAVIEFGAGAGSKTRMLLEQLQDPVAYLPVDISGEHLQATAKRLQQAFPAIEILPVIADFTRPFPLPSPGREPGRKLAFFPGSTIGNFPPAEAVELLRVMRVEAGDGGALLIGFDRRKDPAVLERAYNDAAGITARFNLNLLHRLNREFGADFDTDAFRHEARYNEGEGRIEMRLFSEREQQVALGDRTFSFQRDEAIVTEYSYKYDLHDLEELAASAGFRTEAHWSDEREWFSVLYCESAPETGP